MLAWKAGTKIRIAPTKFYQQAKSFSTSYSTNKQKLCILGSGWAGYNVLRKVDKSKYDVTVISANTYFAMTPLLASTAVGTLEFRCALEPVRSYSSEIHQYIQAWADDIDLQRQVIYCTSAVDLQDTPNKERETYKIDYDQLVIAVGAYSETFGIPGVKEHGYFLKDVQDARNIRGQILRVLEQASQPTITDEERRDLLHFCIVGGGATGVEFSAELHDLISTDLPKAYPQLAPLTRITLFEVSDTILGAFDASLREYAAQHFHREGIMIRHNHRVKKVEKGKLYVEDEVVPFGLLVWSTGLSPNPLVKSVKGVKKMEKSRGLCADEYLRVLNENGEPLPNVRVLGDASYIETHPLPATAQVANQQASYTAKSLNAEARGKELSKKFEFYNRGKMAYLGDWNAIFEQSSSDGHGTGRIPWLIWRSAYFVQTLSIRNKILVPVYWFLNWIFGRDITRF